MKTIGELKKNGFTVDEHVDAEYDGEGNFCNGRKFIGSYKFLSYSSGNDNTLYVTGNVFGNGMYIVLNPMEVFFSAAKEEENIHVKIDGLEFDIKNPLIFVSENASE